jgi:uncharacterized membrane protein
MEKLFGLPAHPLLVHLPIVLIPVVAIVAIALSCNRSWRQRFGIALIVMSAVSCVAMFLAKESGEKLFEYMNKAPAIERHESLADTAMLLTFFLFLAIVALVVLHRRKITKPRSPLSVGVSTITILASVLTVVATIQTGHEGAKVTWEELAPSTTVTKPK